MIPVEHPHLVIAASTHPGMRGKENEDRYSVSAFRMSLEDPTPSLLAILADGIGGHHGGEVAAELAVKAIKSHVMQPSAQEPAQILSQALVQASQDILSHSKSDPILHGMGTTCVCAWIIGNRLYAASAGDSRLYLQRGAKLSRLTTDHTWIQDALQKGTLTPAQARGHPNAHIIRRFLGSANPLTPDLRLRLSSNESDAQAESNQGLKLLPGDRLVLCSDGLTDLVKDGEILEILRTSRIELSAEHMVNVANSRGGHDNITVITLEMPPAAGITRPLRPDREIQPALSDPKDRPPVAWWRISLLGVAILLLVLLLAYTYLH